jgi:uncharacterized damage-inducible protein DinB
MTYYGGKELAEAFRTVRGNTIRIAEEIPEDKYDFSAAPETRSIRQMLVHIALSPTFADEIHGKHVTDMKTVNFGEMMQKIGVAEAKPRTKAEIVAFLTSEGERFAEYLAGLTDGFLAERVTMMPGDPAGTKSRFEMLLGVKEHEMHHRGQLMLAERILGIVPHLTRDRQARMAQAAQAQASATRQ